MNFQYSAIGDNTLQNREHLEKLGWKEKYIQEDADIIVCASNTGMFSAIAKDTQEWFKEYQSECIDCRSNPSLFRAVTAMRDDSDYMQWFVFDRDVYDLEDEYTKGDTLLFKKGDWYLCRHYGMIGKTITHKATLAELQEHFK